MQFELLGAHASAAIERARSDLLTASDLVELREVRLDGQPDWVDGLFEGGDLHEPDYEVFRSVPRTLGTILDVGANWGYSASSIRKAGCSSPIIAFEVLDVFRSCLERVKARLGDEYDFLMCGAGDQSEKLTFLTPVVNDVALTALTSANGRSFDKSTVQNVVAYAKSYLPSDVPYRFRFAATSGIIDTIDSLLGTRTLTAPVDTIGVIKLDVEGFEAPALRGAAGTINRNRPIVMMENNMRDAASREFLLDRGYRYAARDGASLIARDSDPSGLNLFFYHQARIEEYRQIGLIRT